MERYDPLKIEKKWQKIWDETEAFKAEEIPDARKMYVAEMFPYPSGAGLHVGHVRNFTITDVMARFYRQQGFNVLRPFGYDTFGLPAENYAIKTGVSPQEATRINIANFRKQAKSLGYAIDWSREVNTSDPEYYRWTQWCFLQLFKKGLAYQKESYQWWCPVDKTVLANEQVENGHCWRCGHEVEKKKLKQWFFKITAYADELLDDIDALDWPEKIKTMQRNWIGRSEGAEIEFEVASEAGGVDLVAASAAASGLPSGDPQLRRGPSSESATSPKGASRSHDESERGDPATAGVVDASPEESVADSLLMIKVFTTRPDTLFGATFLVLAPEHPLINQLVTDETREKVTEYCKSAIRKSEIERQENKEKTGVFTGSYAINPATGAKIPIWISDYVLAGYGDGAIMAVPAHDERDFAFAEKFDLPIVKVIEKSETIPDDDPCYHGEGELVNSGQFNGTRTEDAREQIVAWLEQQGVGHKKVTYRMRDWLISRQRYWGCPIPIAYDKNGEPHAIPEDQLPVVIPELDDYQPDDSGHSALAKAKDWLKVTIDGEEMIRETDTLDGYACSSWYLWRYASPHDQKHAWDPEAIKYWEPLDIYVGGDHAVAHLLYVRFWCKFFADQGFLPFREPIKKLLYNGYINAPDGKKMSKSKGNVIDPLDVINDGYGADTLRTYEMFIGPYDQDADWSTEGVGGVYRFLNRCWTLNEKFLSGDGAMSPEGASHSYDDNGAGGGAYVSSGHEDLARATRSVPEGHAGAAASPTAAASSSAPASLAPVVTGLARSGSPSVAYAPSEDAAADATNITIRHKTIKKVTEDIHRQNFNTAIAAMMEFVNELYKSTPEREDLVALAKMLKPFAPHLASEMLERLQEDSDEWPTWDDKYLVEATVEVVVQVNGKLRARLQVATEDLRDEDKLQKMALENENVQRFVTKKPKKIIVLPKAHLINVVV